MPPDAPPPNIIWQALSTTHHGLALRHGRAARYPAAVAPFAALEQPDALDELAQLLAPGEVVFVAADRELIHPLLRADGFVPGLQMVFPETAPPPPLHPDLFIESLDCRHAEEMCALIAVAYPGFFQPETCRMGRYFGVRDASGTLIAMGGERLSAPGWIEISGLCSHPDRAGQGLGTAILAHLLALHRGEGSRSFLHASETNHGAVALYLRKGFQTVRRVDLHRLERLA